MKKFFTAATAAIIASVLLSPTAEAKHYHKAYHHIRHSKHVVYHHAKHYRYLRKHIENGERAFYRTPAVDDGSNVDQRYGMPTYGIVQAQSSYYKQTIAYSHNEGHVVEHPAGCAWRLFCGCGASVRVFGHPVRELFLAAAWRKFPSAAPGPGMVAWRYGHVFVIESVNGDGTVVAYDANSGGHLTRIHTVSLRGFHVVNPHGERMAMR